MSQAYMIDPSKIQVVEDFIDKKFGIEYETEDNCITVFEIEYDEHVTLKTFITVNKLWE